MPRTAFSSSPLVTALVAASLALAAACNPATTQVGSGLPAENGNVATEGNQRTPGGGGGPTVVVPGDGGNTALPTSPNAPVVPVPVPVPQQPNGPAVQFLGRFDTITDPTVSTMAWPSSQILIGFEGTRLNVTLRSLDTRSYNGVRQNAWVAASVDDQPSTNYRLNLGANPLTLAQNLAAGQHTVRITQRTEAQMGRVAFVGATSDGKLSYTPPVLARRIEFVGDSGAAGYGADGVSPCDYSAATQNAAVAYPNVVGQLLGAEVRNLSYSGKGLVANRDMVDDAYKTLPILWQRTLPYDDPYLMWDTNAWRPQAVVLITGGNDFYNEVPAQDVYVGKVASFVATLKEVYPGVKVFLGASPMLRNDSHPTQRETAIAYLKRVASQASDANVQYLDIPGPDMGEQNSALGANGFGCDQHPSPVTHRKVAVSIAASLKAQLGW